jgi:hypothetical protein
MVGTDLCNIVGKPEVTRLGGAIVDAVPELAGVQGLLNALALDGKAGCHAVLAGTMG